ncbi:acyl-CoA thioesterase [Pseudotenacibaculum sp. MALMAid0570]|uniref:acyl-CoA thioesterase n=1 Tax=Pseudotenacibaculum sp. MALMAid0570 TaxID=3143938 RepID=UPI0032E04990
MSYKVEFKTKWADFDPNRHLRHTAYNDYAAEARVRYFMHVGFPVSEIGKLNIGPILFTENTSFRKEIHSGETISVNAKLQGISEDKSRWKIRHEIFNQAGKVSAIIEIYGAWLDLEKRKLTVLPKKFDSLFDGMDKTEDFEIIKKRS